jgi:hypothetical protein
VDFGLCVGFGNLKTFDDASRLFTIAHVLFGASIAGAALALYADGIFTRSNEKFIRNYQSLTKGQSDPEEEEPSTQLDVRGPLAFALWTLVGVCYGTVREGWTPIKSLYFAVTSMATYGLEPPSVDVGQGTNAVLVSIFVLVGVPIFAYNVGNVAAAVESLVTRRRDMEILLSRMDKEEFDIAANIVVPSSQKLLYSARSLKVVTCPYQASLRL